MFLGGLMDLCLYPPGLSIHQRTQPGEGSQGPAPADAKGPRTEDGSGGGKQAARQLLPKLGPRAWVKQERDCSHEAMRETLRQRDPTQQVQPTAACAAQPVSAGLRGGSLAGAGRDISMAGS